MKLIRTVLFLAFPFYFISCGTPAKTLPNYLEAMLRTPPAKTEVTYPGITYSKNDLLSIQVYSASTRAKGG